MATHFRKFTSIPDESRRVYKPKCDNKKQDEDLHTSNVYTVDNAKTAAVRVLNVASKFSTFLLLNKSAGL